MKFEFSIIHPTARVKPYPPSFPGGWAGAMWQWHDTCAHPLDVEYILVVHQSRVEEFQKNSKIDLKPQWGAFRVVVNTGRDCLVDQCNAGLIAARGDVLVGSMDDLFAPKDWDSHIRHELRSPFKSLGLRQAVALQCWTGSPRDSELFIPQVQTRELARAVGLHPADYESMFADDEWTSRVRTLANHGQARIIVAPRTKEFKYEHKHPVFKTAEMDEVYALENRKRSYEIGLAAFMRRRNMIPPFPRVPYPDEIQRSHHGGSTDSRSTAETPPSPGENAAGGSSRRPTVETPLAAESGGNADVSNSIRKPIGIAFCTPGETFSMQWVGARDRVLTALADAGYQVNTYLGYSPIVYGTRIQMAGEVLTDALAELYSAPGKLIDSRPDYVFWMDDDNVIQPEHLLNMLAWLESHPEADGICGWCWIRKGDMWLLSVGEFSKSDGVHFSSLTFGQLIEGGLEPKRIEMTGFPAFVMRFKVLETLGQRAFIPITKADLPRVLNGQTFPEEPTDLWFSGEDGSFCLHAKNAGFKFFVDPACKVGHIKPQLIEPDVVTINEKTDPALVEWRQQVNGKPVEAPAEYVRA